jgi:hypothetical protein
MECSEGYLGMNLFVAFTFAESAAAPQKIFYVLGCPTMDPHVGPYFCF